MSIEIVDIVFIAIISWLSLIWYLVIKTKNKLLSGKLQSEVRK